MLNTSNPTGLVLQREELEAVAALLRRHPQVAVVCDEIYEHLLADGQTHHSLAALAPDLADRLFVVNGFAKGWAMTGWRLGYLAGPAAVVKAAIALQSQSTSNVCSFAQRGALAALQAPLDCVHEMARSFEAPQPPHRWFATAQRCGGGASQRGLLCLPGYQCLRLGFDDVLPAVAGSTGIGGGAGVAFGDDRCIRLSCAVTTATIDDGLSRLKSFLQSL